MRNKIIFSVDVEPDLHSGKYFGITEGLKNLEKIADRHNIKPVLFVTVDCVKKYSPVFKKLSKKGWEISLHGFLHERFDEMSHKEKEESIKKSVQEFKKRLSLKPRGFRAPQHSIDSETLDLLEKYGFDYDSSLTPGNLMQLLFFPRKIGLWLKGFFSPVNPYNIRRKLIEIPVSSILIPPVSLTVRIFPSWFLNIYFSSLKILFKKPVFYAHSWDFIELKGSKIDKLFNHKKFIVKLEKLMKNDSKNR